MDSERGFKAGAWQLRIDDRFTIVGPEKGIR